MNRNEPDFERHEPHENYPFIAVPGETSASVPMGTSSLTRSHANREFEGYFMGRSSHRQPPGSRRVAIPG